MDKSTEKDLATQELIDAARVAHATDSPYWDEVERQVAAFEAAAAGKEPVVAKRS